MNLPAQVKREAQPKPTMSPTQWVSKSDATPFKMLMNALPPTEDDEAPPSPKRRRDPTAEESKCSRLYDAMNLPTQMKRESQPKTAMSPTQWVSKSETSPFKMLMNALPPSEDEEGPPSPKRKRFLDMQQQPDSETESNFQ